MWHNFPESGCTVSLRSFANNDSRLRKKNRTLCKKHFWKQTGLKRWERGKGAESLKVARLRPAAFWKTLKDYKRLTKDDVFFLFFSTTRQVLDNDWIQALDNTCIHEPSKATVANCITILPLLRAMKLDAFVVFMCRYSNRWLSYVSTFWCFHCLLQQKHCLCFVSVSGRLKSVLKKC